VEGLTNKVLIFYPTFLSITEIVVESRREEMMNSKDTIRDVVQYLTEAFARIFSPNNDEYPMVGMQPFDAEPYHAPSKGGS
jgi:hypothetical protein